MPQYANLFNELLKDALAASIERVQLATPLVAEVDREEAWHLLSYALKEPTAWAQTRQLLLTLAPKMELAGFREDWIGYLTTAAERGRSLDDLAATAEFALQSGLLYRMLTEYERAIEWLTSSLANFAKLGDRRGQARVLNELAWIEQLRRNYAEAAQHVEQALTLLDEDDPERGMSYRVQGMIAIYQGRWLEAETYHSKSLIYFEQIGDQRKVAWAMQNLAFALRGQKYFEAAIEKFMQAAAILKHIGDNYHWSIALTGLGITHYYQGEADKAISYFLEAETVSRQLHDILQLARLYTNFGLAYLMQHLNEEAAQSFKCSIDLYTQLGEQWLIVNAMDGLAMSYIALRQFEKALVVLEEAIALLPQISNTPNYGYLQESLSQHWQQAKKEQELCFVPQANIA